MFPGLGLVPLIIIFLAAAGAVWVAGTHLSTSTDVLDTQLGLGEAIGGVILLAIATNLPEIAITSSAAIANNLGIAVGNILGGIAIQTVVLVVLDIAIGSESTLTTRAASLVLGLGVLLVILVLAIVVMGTQLPAKHMLWRIEPASLLIVLFWLDLPLATRKSFVQLCPRPDPELPEHLVKVVLDCMSAEVQLGANLRVRKALAG